MIPKLVFDLETIPDVAGLRRLGVPGESDEDVANAAFAAREAKTGRDFLALHVQRIVAIGCVFRSDDGLKVRCLGARDDSEERLITDFYRIIEKYTPQIVSWNGTGFDLPVLHYRALLYGISAPRYWDTGDDDREFRFNNYLSRFHSRHLDLMDVLAGYQGRGAASLDELARLCGFPGKLGMDGSEVWDAYRAGRIDEIRAYCETDVMNTWLIFCRFQLMRGALTAQAYDEEILLARNALKDHPEEHWQAYLKAWPKSEVC